MEPTNARADHRRTAGRYALGALVAGGLCPLLFVLEWRYLPIRLELWLASGGIAVMAAAQAWKFRRLAGKAPAEPERP